MGNNFLLTFSINNGGNDYCWFETEGELKEYIELQGDNIRVREAIEIIDSRKIKLSSK